MVYVYRYDKRRKYPRFKLLSMFVYITCCILGVYSLLYTQNRVVILECIVAGFIAYRRMVATFTISDETIPDYYFNNHKIFRGRVIVKKYTRDKKGEIYKSFLNYRYIYKPKLMFTARDEAQAISRNIDYILDLRLKILIPINQIHIDLNNNICYINPITYRGMKSYKVYGKAILDEPDNNDDD